MTQPHTAAYGDGHVLPGETLARVFLRPIGSSLPLGAFALVPSGLRGIDRQLEELEHEVGVRQQL